MSHATDRMAETRWAGHGTADELEKLLAFMRKSVCEIL